MPYSNAFRKKIFHCSVHGDLNGPSFVGHRKNCKADYIAPGGKKVAAVSAKRATPVRNVVSVRQLKSDFRKGSEPARVNLDKVEENASKVLSFIGSVTGRLKTLGEEAKTLQEKLDKTTLEISSLSKIRDRITKAF